MGIKPGGADDRVIGLEVVREKAEAFLLTDEGMGKRTELKEFPTQGRYGMGVTAADLAGKQKLVGLSMGAADDKVVVVTNKDSAKVVKFDAAGRKKRPARGSGVVSLKSGEAVTRVVTLLESFELPEMPEAPEPKAARAPKAEKVRANGAGKQPPLLEVKPTRAAGKGKTPAKKK
jgi:DNA gyrase subunit A